MKALILAVSIAAMVTPALAAEPTWWNCVTGKATEEDGCPAANNNGGMDMEQITYIINNVTIVVGGDHDHHHHHPHPPHPPHHPHP